MATNDRERVSPRHIDEEMKESFINYSMSVIVSRALPDVRDGLKPVHRRVLYAMNELGLVPGRPYKKSATVVGDVLGKYHPHGDSSVYDALVRMVQDFSLRYPLIDGQGNFGSVEGDPAAAYRYTEARLMRVSMDMLADIDKNTVDFVPNYDDRLTEPSVLPAVVPNLLINGSTGIAVGMATNIPPHNIREVIAATLHLIEHQDATPTDLRRFIKGPDFPTAAYVYGKEGIKDYFETGRGRIVMRAKAVIEEKESGRSQIVVTEIPYMVNSAKLQEDIAAKTREKVLEGISDIRNESDRDGLRIVIDVKRDAMPRVVLNQLYKHTQLQSTFGVILLALVPDPTSRRLVPKIMGVPEVLQHYITHRHEVIIRRTQWELDKALEREHILEGLKIAVDNIDEVIKIIRAADDTPSANAELRARFKLSEIQTEAILNMRLAKLTGLEIEKLEEEIKELRKFIKECRAILASKDKRNALMKGELQKVLETYGDPRRTEILSDQGEFNIEDLIADEEMIVTVTHAGYVKRTAASLYRRQRRGGKGSTGATLKAEDSITMARTMSSHEFLGSITADGRCFWTKVHELPQAARAAKGRPMTNVINVTADTKIRAMVPVREFSDSLSLIFVTKKGTIKKTKLSEFKNIRANGVKAIKIENGDELIDVQVTTGTNDIVLATKHGLSVRFKESDVRDMGRDTTGVKGIELAKGDSVVGMVIVKRDDATILVVTEKGMGKCSKITDYRVQKRGGKGLITVNRTDKTGDVVSIMEVVPEDELMLMTKQGITIRTQASQIRITGRIAQGVKLVDLAPKDYLVDVARVVAEDKNADGSADEGEEGEDEGGEE